MAIDKLKKDLEKKEKLKKQMMAEGKKKYVDTLSRQIKSIKSKIKEEEKTASAKAIKNYKKPKKKYAGLSRDKCIEELEKIRNANFLKAESTKKKNISSGRAYKDGSLKPGASLKKEAESIENKADDGHSITKAEQKKIPVNIDEIIRNVVKMIRTQKDSEKLLRELIQKLNRTLDNVRRGRLVYEG